MKKVMSLVLMLLLVVIPFAAAESHTNGDSHPAPGDGPGIMGPDGVFKLTEKLKLNDDQIKQLNELKDASKRDLFKARNDIMTTVWDIQDEMKKDAPDRARLYKLSDKIADNEKQLSRIRIDQTLKIKEILTKEQYTKLTVLLEAQKKQSKNKFLGKIFENDK